MGRELSKGIFDKNTKLLSQKPLQEASDLEKTSFDSNPHENTHQFISEEFKKALNVLSAHVSSQAKEIEENKQSLKQFLKLFKTHHQTIEENVAELEVEIEKIKIYINNQTEKISAYMKLRKEDDIKIEDLLDRQNSILSQYESQNMVTKQLLSETEMQVHKYAGQLKEIYVELEQLKKA